MFELQGVWEGVSDFYVSDLQWVWIGLSCRRDVLGGAVKANLVCAWGGVVVYVDGE